MPDPMRSTSTPPRSRSGERGFTLVETMTALLVLALGVGALGDVVRASIRYGDAVAERRDSSRALAAAFLNGNATIADAEGVALAQPALEADLGPDCLYDVVGRRCR